MSPRAAKMSAADREHLTRALDSLVQAYRAWNRLEDAAAWKARRDASNEREPTLRRE